MSTENHEETFAERSARLRRERKEQAGHAMAGKPLDIRAGTPIPAMSAAGTQMEVRIPVGEHRSFTNNEGTFKIIAVPGAPKPGKVSRWAGYAIGSIIAAGGVLIVGILVVKAIVWAWYL